MVYLSNQTGVNLNNVQQGLLKWNKFDLSEGFIIDYINYIIDVCNMLDSIVYHFITEYDFHK